MNKFQCKAAPCSLNVGGSCHRPKPICETLLITDASVDVNELVNDRKFIASEFQTSVSSKNEQCGLHRWHLVTFPNVYITFSLQASFAIAASLS